MSRSAARAVGIDFEPTYPTDTAADEPCLGDLTGHPEPDSSRGSVQMLGVILALTAVCTLAMMIGLVATVGRGLAWW